MNSTVAKRIKLKDKLPDVSTKAQPSNLQAKKTPDIPHITLKREGSPALSYVSMKSERSMDPPGNFMGGATTYMTRMKRKMSSPAPSNLSMKSDHSMDPPLPNFQGENSPFIPRFCSAHVSASTQRSYTPVANSPSSGPVLNSSPEAPSWLDYLLTEHVLKHKLQQGLQQLKYELQNQTKKLLEEQTKKLLEEQQEEQQMQTLRLLEEQQNQTKKLLKEQQEELRLDQCLSPTSDDRQPNLAPAAVHLNRWGRPHLDQSGGRESRE
ncbi:probable serine/threonine-protein kinase cdc7 [Sardina pilchardus]|uniref:probable serine/threonine-protein kinase cdc7 n=1 Tax=Sardina pilchardus TaxID=27697 RepID=UPI002E0D1C0C